MFLRSNVFNARLRTIVGAVGQQKCLQTCQCAIKYANQKEIPVLQFQAPTLFNQFSYRTFANEPLPKHKDVFGDLGSNKYRKAKMDPIEEAEERFTENAVPQPARFHNPPKYYHDLIQSHLEKGDLVQALGVLDLAKSNRDELSTYMFRLVLRPYANNGDIKTCFKLYARMKKHGLKPNAQVYTSLINSIANHQSSDFAMEKLYYLRKECIEKQVELNDVNYNAMIAAYGRHGRVQEAFVLVDEMRDKKMPMSLNTYNVLFVAAVGQKNGGLVLALKLWHMMKQHKIQPDIKTYNLLLRCIRDTNFGDLKLNEVFLKGDDSVDIKFMDIGKPNLLAQQPVVTVVPEVKFIKPESVEVREKRKPFKLQPKIDMEVLDKKSIEKIEMDSTNYSLNSVRNQNKLILFGGFEHILDLMMNDNVQPDQKTFSYLVEMSPESVAIEDVIIKRARKHNVTLDNTFFNILMKKRCFRHDYDSARAVLKDMEKFNLFPDVVTWGTLAMTCDTPFDIKNFVETMQSVGFEPDTIISGILLLKASRSKHKDRFKVMVWIADFCMKNDIKLTRLTIEKMDNFQRFLKQQIKDKHKTTRFRNFRDGYDKWCRYYDKWKSQSGSKKIVEEN